MLIIKNKKVIVSFFFSVNSKSKNIIIFTKKMYCLILPIIFNITFLQYRPHQN